MSKETELSQSASLPLLVLESDWTAFRLCFARKGIQGNKKMIDDGSRDNHIPEDGLKTSIGDTNSWS